MTRGLSEVEAASGTPTDRPPRVSIVVPCYRLGRFLDEAVGSCLLQTYRSFEVLVVDDGSDDDETRSLLDGYRRPATSLLRLAHRGLAEARNAGAGRARGELLCFLDADDRLHPEYLEQAVAALDADPGLSFVGSGIQAFGSESWTYQPVDCDLPTLLAECTVSTAAVLRREAFEAVGGFDTAMPGQGDEDWDLWINLLRHGYRGRILPEVLFYYRRRPGSMVESCYYSDQHLELSSYLFHKYSEHYREHLSSILDHKDREIADLERSRRRLASTLEHELEPELRARLGRAGSALEVTDPAAALDSARAEVAALRRSWSWRLTAPLRVAHSILLGRRR